MSGLHIRAERIRCKLLWALRGGGVKSRFAWRRGRVRGHTGNAEIATGTDQLFVRVCSFVRAGVLLLYFFLISRRNIDRVFFFSFYLFFQYSVLLKSTFLLSLLSCGIFIDTIEEVGEKMNKDMTSKEGETEDQNK